MAFTSTEIIKTKTYKNWGYHLDNTYIANNGGFSGFDDYWEIKKPIDVSYEASVGGSFKIGGMTFFENERTNVNFYSSTTVNSSKRISTVRLTKQNQTVSVPSNAKIMIICVRTISPNESGNVTVTLRQKTTQWNTSNNNPPTAGMMYDFNGTTNSVLNAFYDNDGSKNYQWQYIYDNDGTTNRMIWSGTPTHLYNKGNQETNVTGGWQQSTTVMGDSAQITSWPHGPQGKTSFNTSNVGIEYTGSYGGIMIATKKAINFKDLGINSITINCSTTIGGWGYDNYRWANGLTYATWAIALVPNLNDTQAYTKSYSHDYGNWYINGASTDTRTESFSKTISGLSSLTGSYYVIVSLYRSVPGTFKMTLNTITCA